MAHQITRRSLAALALALGASAACGRAQAQQADPALAFVDPELRGPLAQPDRIKIPRMTEGDLVAFQKRAAPPSPPLLPSPAVATRQIPGPKEAAALRVFIVNAKAGAARPAILHIHGGGYILGSPTTELPNLQRIAAAQDCVIVSVDYRLAPQTRFPGALEDNYAALRWLHANAAELGVDRRRIIVMGESAGGGHAAALAIAVRDRGELDLAGQVLVYPMLDDRTGSTRQPPPHQGAYVWTAEQNRLGWSALLGVPAGSANPPPGSVPARVENLRGLPPTFIAVGDWTCSCRRTSTTPGACWTAACRRNCWWSRGGITPSPSSCPRRGCRVSSWRLSTPPSRAFCRRPKGSSRARPARWAGWPRAFPRPPSGGTGTPPRWPPPA